MKVLVYVASKHGATTDIGDAIALQLRKAGLSVDVVGTSATVELSGYDGFVIGSGVYLGKWLQPGREFVESNAGLLSKRPVWLFSSGPITPQSIADPHDYEVGNRLMTLVGAREHKMFAGRLQKEGLGITERVAVRMVGSPWGDYRPWDEIHAWADQIAKELMAVPV